MRRTACACNCPNRAGGSVACPILRFTVGDERRLLQRERDYIGVFSEGGKRLSQVSFIDAVIMRTASRSPWSSADMKAFACFMVTCGGRGGTLGSVTISTNVG